MNPEEKQAARDRISLLSNEIDANEEENRAMTDEINGLYKAIDAPDDGVEQGVSDTCSPG